ncbi:MAG TPA: RES family NAD+ phosphorylase [Candidatus Limnocylindrales bacterium]|nr:RES family NAD+ phosphorylase [Candidatus Limnocylindrales bacterium]
MAALDASRLGPLVTTTSGPTWCHAPADEPFDLEALARPGDGDDRWSDGARPTAYLAGDRLTAVAEYVRHARAGGSRLARDIVQLELRPTRVLDFRRDDVREALGPRSAPSACLDRSIAQDLGRDVRGLGLVEGIVVPSMAFLDQPDRYNVVLFVEALAGGIASALASPVVVGSIRLEP